MQKVSHLSLLKKNQYHPNGEASNIEFHNDDKSITHFSPHQLETLKDNKKLNFTCLQYFIKLLINMRLQWKSYT